MIEIVRLSPALPKARPTRRLEDVPETFRLEPSTSSTFRRNVPLSLRPQRTSRATVTRGASSTGRIVMVSRDTPPSTVAVPYASGAGVNVSDPSASTAGAALNNSGRDVCSANRAPAFAHGARYGPESSSTTIASSARTATGSSTASTRTVTVPHMVSPASVSE